MRKPLKGSMQQSSIIWKVLLLLALMLFFTFIAMGIWIAAFQGSQSTRSLEVLQMLQTVCTFALPCFVAAWLWSNQPLSWLQLDKSVEWIPALLAVALIISAMPSINLLAWLNEQIVLPDFLSGLEEIFKRQEETARKLTEQFIRADNAGMLVFNLFLMAFLPAFCEELCFRGTLQQLFSDASAGKNGSIGSKHHVAIWVTAILFSAIHFQFYGFIPRMLMGALFGYLIVWSGSIWLPVIAHFTNNAMSVILYNVYYMQGKNVDEIDALGTGDTLWMGVVSMVVVGALIWLMWRINHKKEPQ